MAELTRYRRHFDLAALPYGGETIPLLLPSGGTHRTMTRGTVHLIIKQVSTTRSTICNQLAKRRSLRQSGCARPLPFGCGTRQALGRWMAKSNCDTSVITWGMNPSQSRVSTYMRTTMIDIGQQKPG